MRKPAVGDKNVCQNFFSEFWCLFFVARRGNQMKQQQFTGNCILGALLIICCCLFMPADAWALQSHGAPEGLYVHQMAHVFVVLAMAYWFWDISRSSFGGRGWRYLQVFCVLMLAWNVVAFTGHAVAVGVDAKQIVREGGYLNSRLTGPLDFRILLYYLTRFDHFVIVPALFFLFLGVRSLYKDVEKKHNGEAKK